MAGRSNRSKTPDFTKIRFLTGTGVAAYPHLNKPDSYESGPEKYKVDLIFDDSDGGFSFTTDEGKIGPMTAVDFLAKAEEFYNAECKKIAGTTKKKLSPLPLPIARIDDDEDPNHGKIRVRAQMRAEIERNNETVQMRPSFYDARRKPIKHDKLPKIGSGSRLRVAGMLSGFLTGNNSGMTTYLNAVQVITVEEFGRSAESYGFGDEDGFDSEEAAGYSVDESDDNEIEMDED